MGKVDDVLSELEGLGALGGSEKTPPFKTQIEAVLIDKGLPEIGERDERIVQALGTARHGLDTAIAGLVEMGKALDVLLATWSPNDQEGNVVPHSIPLETPETVQESVQVIAAPRSTESASSSVRSSQGAGKPDSSDPVYQAAREAAIKKIRGEDIPEDAHRQAEGKRLRAEEEDDARFIGHDRAVSNRSEEVSIRTVGVVKPSFSAEGNDGT